jgi:hypothetical protein
MKIYYPIGNYGLKCHKCNYESKPQEEKKCGNNTTDCTTGHEYCFSCSGFTAYNRSDGGYVVVRDCDSSITTASSALMLEKHAKTRLKKRT